MPQPSSRTTFVLLAATVLVCVLAYLGGLSGGFLFDDFQTLVDNPALRAIGTPARNWLAVALSSDAGALRRPVSMLSFGLNVAVFGMSPFAFKCVNLAIHLVNGALIYAIGCRLADRLTAPNTTGKSVAAETLALMAAGLWLLHPLHVSSVVYIVQRMNELATLFTLAGLLCYADGRVRMLRGEPALAQALLGFCLFGFLAVLSKENGALIVAYALVIEAVCFRFDAPQPVERRVIKGFFWLTIALPAALVVAYLATHPQWSMRAYAGRDFTLYQRLLSETRVVCDYLVWTFVPNPGWMGLFHDDIAPSTALLRPISTLVAIGCLAALVLLAWRLRRRYPGVTFAIAWFLVGHSLESSFLPLELVFEHRNYLPMAGVLLGTVCTIAPWLTEQMSARTATLVGVAVLAMLGALTAVRATSWGDPTRLALTDVANHPDSARCQYEAARAIVATGIARGDRDKAEQEAVPYLKRSAALDPNQLHAATSLLLIEARSGTVSPEAITDLADRLRRVPSHVQASAFMDMLVSASEQSLSLTPADIAGLVEASLSNPHFPPKVRAMIMNDYGAYQFNIVRDPQQAITLTTAAAAEDPQNPYFEVNLAKLAVALGQADVARQHLQAARDRDKARFYDNEIATLQAQIAQQENRP